MLFQINGFRMNALVAPTICMVLIEKRFEYTASRMELLINNIAMIVKIPQIIKIQKLITGIINCTIDA